MKKRSYGEDIKALFKLHKWNKQTLSWISEALNIPFNTLKTWSMKLGRWEDIEDQRSNNGNEKLFSDADLIAYAEQNENATLLDIWNHFNVSDVAILKRFKSLKYSYKKKTWNIKREMKKNEKNSVEY